MIEFIKSHIVLILSILILLALIALAVVLLMPQPTNPVETGVIPADQVALNEELSAEEKQVSLTALDYIYTFGNYSAAEHRLESLTGNVTESMQSRVDTLLSELNSNPDKFSTMQPSSDGYEVIISGNNPKAAQITIPAFLTDNVVMNKTVKVNLKLIADGNNWLLDEFNVE